MLFSLARPGVSLDGEYPDRAAFRNLGELTGKQRIQPRLHGARVDAPARLHRDVLFVVNHERRWLPDDAGIGRELPQELSAGRVESMKHAVVGSAAEHQAARGGQHWTPIRRTGVGVR